MAGRFSVIPAIATSVIVLGALAGCVPEHHQAYVQQSGLGAQQYTPSVFVEPGNEGRYQKVLGLCREVAEKRQLTASQQAALRAETGMTEAAVEGALGGLAETMFSGGNVGGASIAGGVIGLVGSAVAESGKGTVATAAATRTALLNCLRATSRGNTLWTVVE